YARYLQEEKAAWKDISEERQAEIVKKLMQQVTGHYGDGRFQGSARIQGMSARLEAICLRSIRTMTAQLIGSSFEPASFEVSFRDARNLEGTMLRMKNGEKLQIQGRIDRIDLCRQDQTVYVKIIDYKSGNTGFDLADVYHGLSLQLALYMSAALELEEKLSPGANIVPAGFLYERLQDPVVEEEDPSAAEQAILMQMRPDGMVNRDDTVLALLDESMEYPGKSWKIPAGRTKRGDLEKTSKCASEEQLRMLGKYARLKMEQGLNAVQDGNIWPSPAKWKNRTACDYCAYRDVCGFDEKLPGYAYRRLRKLESNAFWYLADQALQKGETDGTGMDE
ncbi:MAG: PD-(D/E)XK nuclease family protein, partial [Lachnospiraceae bacterium]|nr:PD-(D/E)XK nuclease family protein [Lachnospiraceae bacterium]